MNLCIIGPVSLFNRCQLVYFSLPLFQPLARLTPHHPPKRWSSSTGIAPNSLQPAPLHLINQQKCPNQATLHHPSSSSTSSTSTNPILASHLCFCLSPSPSLSPSFRLSVSPPPFPLSPAPAPDACHSYSSSLTISKSQRSEPPNSTQKTASSSLSQPPVALLTRKAFPIQRLHIHPSRNRSPRPFSASHRNWPFKNIQLHWVAGRS